MKPKSKRAAAACTNRVFLLSPANAAGKRAQLLLREEAMFGLAQRLRNGGLALGEAFSFISGLYFRGKLAYASTFANPPDGAPGVLVITACGGLMSPDALITQSDLCKISAALVDASEPRYRIPLERDARRLHKQLGKNSEVVLLGSVATPKYVEPLLAIFGDKLVFSRGLCRTWRHEPGRADAAMRARASGTNLCVHRHWQTARTQAREASKNSRRPLVRKVTANLAPSDSPA